MELIHSEQLHDTKLSVAVNNTISSSRAFISANTIECSQEEIKKHHIIPVFLKDNEPLISHLDLLEITQYVVEDVLKGEEILKPSIRMSHPIKGRVPEAKNKPAKDLLEWEKTLYYERMAFVIEVPSISEEINGNRLSLMIGGVKAYNEDNLYNKSGADQHFRLFIGYQNMVCTNLCVASNGAVLNLKVKSKEQLAAAVYALIQNYDRAMHLTLMRNLCSYALTERQFATLMGRCRMFQFLPAAEKRNVPELLVTDTQLNQVCRDYYRDKSFCRDESGNINLWSLYNLFTDACKSSYIDTFIERNTDSFAFCHRLYCALKGGEENWYIE